MAERSPDRLSALVKQMHIRQIGGQLHPRPKLRRHTTIGLGNHLAPPDIDIDQCFATEGFQHIHHPLEQALCIGDHQIIGSDSHGQAAALRKIEISREFLTRLSQATPTKTVRIAVRDGDFSYGFA